MGCFLDYENQSPIDMINMEKREVKSMEVMNLENQQVVHKRFGKGIVGEFLHFQPIIIHGKKGNFCLIFPQKRNIITFKRVADQRKSSFAARFYIYIMHLRVCSLSA